MNNGKDFKKFANSRGISTSKLDYADKQISSSLTPYILEERELRVTQMDIFSRMLRDRILWLTGEVGDGMSSIVMAQLMYLDDVDNASDITMHIDTPGGSVKSGLSIVDVMDYVKSDIATINTGMCASMGSVILSAGAKGKRFSLPYAKVMTHMVSHGSQGNVQDTRVSQIEAEKYNYILFKILAENCGKSFEDMLNSSRVDNWLHSDEALEFGIIDEVIGGNKKKGMNEMLEGFDDYYYKEVLKK
jgi:ATP-dependent Clp protease protease subunit